MIRRAGRAWEYGSIEVEREANADAYDEIPPGSYQCCECEVVYDLAEDGVGRNLEIEHELDGHYYYEDAYLCPHCALMEDPPEDMDEEAT